MQIRHSYVFCSALWQVINHITVQFQDLSQDSTKKYFFPLSSGFWRGLKILYADKQLDEIRIKDRRPRLFPWQQNSCCCQWGKEFVSGCHVLRHHCASVKLPLVSSFWNRLLGRMRKMYLANKLRAVATAQTHPLHEWNPSVLCSHHSISDW